MSADQEDFQLSATDKASNLWRRLKTHLEDRLARARMLNDRMTPESETAAQRGEIRALKSLIALGEDRSPVITE